MRVPRREARPEGILLGFDTPPSALRLLRVGRARSPTDASSPLVDSEGLSEAVGSVSMVREF